MMHSLRQLEGSTRTRLLLVRFSTPLEMAGRSVPAYCRSLQLPHYPLMQAGTPRSRKGEKALSIRLLW